MLRQGGGGAAEEEGDGGGWVHGRVVLSWDGGGGWRPVSVAEGFYFAVADVLGAGAVADVD